MKLDRNINPDGRGKYALLKLRRQEKGFPPECQAAAELLRSHGLIDFGDTPDTEFFVIRLKDQNAGPALESYARSAYSTDPEFSAEVRELATRATLHPNKKQPD